MKRVINQIQQNASDEQKLTFALFASVSTGVLLLMLWIAYFNIGGLQKAKSTNNSNNSAVPTQAPATSKTEQKQSQGASAASGLDKLNTNFYDLIKSKSHKDETQTNKDSVYKVKPLKLNL